MKTLVTIIKALLYVPVVITEYALMCLLELARQLRKAFEDKNR